LHHPDNLNVKCAKCKSRQEEQVATEEFGNTPDEPDVQTRVDENSLDQGFSTPVLATHCSAYCVCLPYLTHLIQILSSLGYLYRCVN